MNRLETNRLYAVRHIPTGALLSIRVHHGIPTLSLEVVGVVYMTNCREDAERAITDKHTGHFYNTHYLVTSSLKSLKSAWRWQHESADHVASVMKALKNVRARARAAEKRERQWQKEYKAAEPQSLKEWNEPT